MSTRALDTIAVIMFGGLVGCIAICLLGVIILAAIHDGQLATQAMNCFVSIIQWALVSGGLWGAAHSIVARVVPGGPTAPAASAAPVAPTEPVAGA